MNRVVLIGRLTKDSEIKYLPGNGTAVTSFTLAVDKRGKDGKKEADFINCVCYGKIAENTANYTTKGSLVGVAGRINIRSYNAKDGTKRFVVEVVAEEVQFLDKKTPKNSTNSGNECDYSESMQPVDDGDIPF